MSPVSISQLVVLATVLISTSMSVTAMPIDTLELVELEERQGVSCYPMELDNLKKLPAWNKVVDYARDLYGEGGGPTLNPPEYLDRGANACINEPRVKIQWAQQPSCSSSKTIGNAISRGADSTLTFTQTTGVDQSASWTVTKSSEITSSISFNVGFEIEGLFSAGMETSLSGTVKNERSSTFTTSNNNMLETTVSYQNKDGNKCRLELDTQTCRATGKGSVPVVASGWVWFYYPSARASKNNPGGSKHFHWAVPLSRVLTEDERTTMIEFQGPMNAVSKSAYALDCTPLGASKAVSRAAIKPGTKSVKPSKSTRAPPRSGSTSGKTTTKSASTKPKASSNPKSSPRPRAPQRND